MGTRIRKCDKCEKEELTRTWWDDESFLCRECNQPERSKREDSEIKLVYRKPNPEWMNPVMKAKYEKAEKLLRCGALNIVETQ